MESRREGRYLSVILRLKRGDGSGFSVRLVSPEGHELEIREGTYFIRIWLEPHSGRVRGTLRHAESSHTLHFQSSSRIGDFIHESLREAALAKAPYSEASQGGDPMSESIVFSANVVISNGPAMAIKRTIAVDAYDKLDVAVPTGAADLEIDLQPGAAGQVHFLLVSSSQYGANLSYKVNSSASPTTYALDEPHLLLGAGSVAMLDAAPAKLFFSNSLGADAQVQILIGRDATP